MSARDVTLSFPTVFLNQNNSKNPEITTPVFFSVQYVIIIDIVNYLSDIIRQCRVDKVLNFSLIAEVIVKVLHYPQS